LTQEYSFNYISKL